MSILLAFDFGTRRIGCAIGNSITESANPLAMVSAENGQPDWNAIDKHIAEWRPSALVVGDPLHVDGSSSKMTHRARAFAKELEARYHLPIHHIDECLSSVAATQERDRAFHQPHKNLDSLAAVVILEHYFKQEPTR